MFKKIDAASYAPINSICLMILAGTALTWILVYAKTILMPYTIALFLGMVLDTIARWGRAHWKIPYWVGILLGILLFLGAAALI